MLSTMTRITLITNVLAAAAIPAFAATESRSSQPETVVWGFLGLCALIILAQIAPLVRNLKKHSKMASEQTKGVKLHQS
jgi:hypothetical protein